jgi:Chromo (CHRromatin Organisation MOdifier) domain
LDEQSADIAPVAAVVMSSKKKAKISVDEYVVEEIVSKRVKDNLVTYEIKWMGYPSSANTFEPEVRPSTNANMQ